MAGSSKKSLQEYRGKRRFKDTPEPEGEESRQDREPLFVIQKHDATNLHYDFRLSLNGVLKSWAVPKGLSTDPREKRLAIQTEDHPLEYADFEGVIPQGHYGGGVVLVWDTGGYKNTTVKGDREVPLAKGLEQGHVTIELAGKKLRGGYALTRMERGDGRQWLLVKIRDDEADARRNPVTTEPRSVLSGRTLKEIASDAHEKQR